jgi:hypothetical protein
MLSIGPLFALSLSLFSIFAYLISLEENRGKRFLFSRLRSELDNIIEKITSFLLTRLTYLGRHIIKLSWYYGIHKALRLILTGLIKTYDFLETAFMRNRDRARTLKIEKRTYVQSHSHLGQMAEHKASTALTESQKKKLLQKKLERG